jgi:glutathione S-transferase
MSIYTLFGDYRSGNCYKVALFLSVSGTPYEYRHEDFLAPRDQRSEDFQASSRFGELPVLLDGDTAMCQSNSILCFLSNRTIRFNFSEYAHRQEVMEWLFWEANNIGYSVSNLRFKTKFSSNSNEIVLADLRSRATRDLDRFEQELSIKSFLVGDTPSIADLSICAYLYWLEDTGLDVGRWPHIKAWLDKISELPGWFHPDQMPRENTTFE